VYDISARDTGDHACVEVFGYLTFKVSKRVREISWDIVVFTDPVCLPSRPIKTVRCLILHDVDIQNCMCKMKVIYWYIKKYTGFVQLHNLSSVYKSC
jgi:hypothetical protein